jgi:hypothetical protein
MKDPKTISFVGTTQIETILKKWAADKERSVSYILRKMVETEAQKQTSEEEKEGKHQTA